MATDGTFGAASRSTAPSSEAAPSTLRSTGAALYGWVAPGDYLDYLDDLAQHLRAS